MLASLVKTVYSLVYFGLLQTKWRLVSGEWSIFSSEPTLCRDDPGHFLWKIRTILEICQ